MGHPGLCELYAAAAAAAIVLRTVVLAAAVLLLPVHEHSAALHNARNLNVVRTASCRPRGLRGLRVPEPAQALADGAPGECQQGGIITAPRVALHRFGESNLAEQPEQPVQQASAQDAAVARRFSGLLSDMCRDEIWGIGGVMAEMLAQMQPSDTIAANSHGWHALCKVPDQPAKPAHARARPHTRTSRRVHSPAFAPRLSIDPGRLTRVLGPFGLGTIAGGQIASEWAGDEDFSQPCRTELATQLVGGQPMRTAACQPAVAQLEPSPIQSPLLPPPIPQVFHGHGMVGRRGLSLGLVGSQVIQINKLPVQLSQPAMQVASCGVQGASLSNAPLQRAEGAPVTAAV